MEDEATSLYTESNVSWSTIAEFEKAPFDHKVQYGAGDLQFGELRVPDDKGKYPVVVFIHGGCWLSSFNLDHVSQVSADLVKAGYAVWTPEYRRVGNEGGAWTGTFDDAGAFMDHLRTMENDYPIDLSKVIVMGHSAGGHLALWVAARKNISANSTLYTENPLPVHAVIALAPITDLAEYDKVNNSCSSAVTELMGGDVTQVPERYEVASPINQLPLDVPTFLVHGSIDNIVPLAQSTNYVAAAKAAADNAQVIEVEGAGHFDMVSPFSVAWGEIRQVLKEL